jgi:hypothetical protein
MPYASKAQQGLFHSPNSPVSAKEVAKFDKESKGEKGLPKHKKSNPKKNLMRAKVLRGDETDT